MYVSVLIFVCYISPGSILNIYPCLINESSIVKHLTFILSYLNRFTNSNMNVELMLILKVLYLHNFQENAILKLLNGTFLQLKVIFLCYYLFNDNKITFQSLLFLLV